MLTRDLIDRYGVGRSAVYSRMGALGITASRVGRKSSITEAEVELMDRLHAFIKNGGTTREFLEENPNLQSQEQSLEAKVKQLEETVCGMRKALKNLEETMKNLK